MENITAQSIKKIAKLARIEIAENSCDYLKSQVEATLLWTKQLNEVNTSNVEILTNVHNSLLRSAADKISDGNITDEILQNAPNAKYNYFAVPKVIE